MAGVPEVGAELHGLPEERLGSLLVQGPRVEPPGGVAVAHAAERDPADLQARSSQADVLAVQLLEPEVLGQGRRQEEPGVGHEVGVVELHGQHIQAMRRSHLQGAFLIW